MLVNVGCTKLQKCFIEEFCHLTSVDWNSSGQVIGPSYNVVNIKNVSKCSF